MWNWWRDDLGNQAEYRKSLQTMHGGVLVECIVCRDFRISSQMPRSSRHQLQKVIDENFYRDARTRTFWIFYDFSVLRRISSRLQTGTRLVLATKFFVLGPDRGTWTLLLSGWKLLSSMKNCSLEHENRQKSCLHGASPARRALSCRGQSVLLSTSPKL